MIGNSINQCNLPALAQADIGIVITATNHISGVPFDVLVLQFHFMR